MRKVLIANRGEIAVRVVRACRETGIDTVAVYADPDRESVHVRLADEAIALGGTTATETYLDIERILKAAEHSGADAVHPGYGFLSENADFAEAVQAAGLTWIGPPPDAIRALGDKVSARRIAEKAGAPSVAGTADPVPDAEGARAFAVEHGLPIAVKAAYGGGGRGLKVARTLDEIPDKFDSAVREAGLAFGRGECFVERYLDRTRHVETQCLADVHGRVVVVSTRDCTLQRRHQKLVEEAPAPFLETDQIERMTAASEAILAAAGYVGAGTCEFLVGDDGTVSFLEVNTRLQVEHPVTEEVTGVDLVCEQLRIARGEPIGFDSVTTRGHAIEFRINGEDAGRGFLPVPGTVTNWRTPEGPGVRLDSGVETGTEIGSGFDSMLAKLVVVGADRAQALVRARRALFEFEVEGIPTVLPFHRAVVDDPAFVGTGERFDVHTRWIETEFDNRIEPADPADVAEAEESRSRYTVEVDSRRIEVTVPSRLSGAAPAIGGSQPKRRSRRSASGGACANDPDSPALSSPMHGSVVRVAVTEGQQVSEGDLVAVLEAMKMEQPVNAHRDGRVADLRVEPGATLASGDVLCEIQPN